MRPFDEKNLSLQAFEQEEHSELSELKMAQATLNQHKEYVFYRNYRWRGSRKNGDSDLSGN